MTQDELVELLRQRAASWRAHSLDHGEGSVLQHRLEARADECDALAVIVQLAPADPAPHDRATAAELEK